MLKSEILLVSVTFLLMWYAVWEPFPSLFGFENGSQICQTMLAVGHFAMYTKLLAAFSTLPANPFLTFLLPANSVIASFHMTSVKFKLRNYRYWSSWDITFMMYKSSWKQIIIIFSGNSGWSFLIFLSLLWDKFTLS